MSKVTKIGDTAAHFTSVELYLLESHIKNLQEI